MQPGARRGPRARPRAGRGATARRMGERAGICEGSRDGPDGQGGLTMVTVLGAYLLGVVTLLALASTIGREERVSLAPILAAAFGWPVLGPIVFLRAWAGR